MPRLPLRSPRSLVLGVTLLVQLAARPLAAAPGDLDPTFGVGGVVTTDITSGDETAFAVTQRSDGTIVAGGQTRMGTSFDFAVVRYRPDGSLDPTFGGTGIVTTPIENGTDIVQGLVAQPDGKVIAVGWGFIVGHRHDFALVRYAADGSLDPTWGSAGTGKVTTNIGPAAKSDDAPFDIVLQSDGKVVVAGETQDPVTLRTDFALVRYLPTGLLDPTFGGAGIVVTPIGLGGSARALVLQADGRLVAAGRSDASDGFHVTLARYNANGTLDASFGGTGVVVTPIGTDEGVALAIVQQTDGALVVAGEVQYGTGGTDFVLVRYRTDGTLDPTFGAGGIVVTPIGDGGSARGLVLAGTKLVAAGTASVGARALVAVARYDAAGALDPAFGQAGITLTALAGSTEANALLLQPDGKLVAAGHTFGTSGEFAVLRYQGDPPPSTTTSTSTTTTTSTTSTTRTTTSTTATTTTSTTATTTTTTSTTTSSTTTTLSGTPGQLSVRSIGAEDGTILESSATSGVGGSLNSTGTNVQVGDHVTNGQVKAILSFDTSAIPDNATVTSATVRLQRVGVLGTNPFTILGQCWIDVQRGGFGGSAALALGDFQATATAPRAGTLSNPATNGDWSTGTLSTAGLAAINRGGRTQLRLAFAVHDNGDGDADRILFGSGNVADPTLRPELQITYVTP
jgi:uncharacterized delta-60 repeat protein